MGFLQHSGTRVTLSVRSTETGHRGEGPTWCLSASIPESWRPLLTIARLVARIPVVAPQQPTGLHLGNEGPKLCLSSPVLEAVQDILHDGILPHWTKNVRGRGPRSHPLFPGTPFASIPGLGSYIGRGVGWTENKCNNLGCWGGVTKRGMVDRRQSTFSDPFVSLTLWVKFLCEHWMCIAITELTVSVIEKNLPGLGWALLPSVWLLGLCLAASSMGKQPEPCLTKNRLQKYI